MIKTILSVILPVILLFLTLPFFPFCFVLPENELTFIKITVMHAEVYRNLDKLYLASFLDQYRLKCINFSLTQTEPRRNLIVCAEVEYNFEDANAVQKHFDAAHRPLFDSIRSSPSKYL